MADSLYISNDCLLDTSWSLYSAVDLKWPSRDLQDPKAFAGPAREFDSLLRRTAPGGKEYDEEDSDRAGGYHKSSWNIIQSNLSARQPRILGVLITVEYDRSSYKAVLLRQLNNNNPQQRTNASSTLPLLLLRMPSTLTRCFLKFLETGLSATSVQPLKLHTPLLCSILESYIHTLSTLPSGQNLPSYSRDASLQDLPSQMIRDVRITLSFSGVVAPHLRTLDLDVPFDTVWKLVRPGVETSNGSTTETGFLNRLANHLNRTTGLNLPWRSSNGQPASTSDLTADNAEDVIRISRIACASLVISTDGKVKIVGKFAENILDEEMLGLVTKANRDLIEMLVRRAGEND